MATLYGKWHHVSPIKDWMWLNLIDACGNPLKYTYLPPSLSLSLSLFFIEVISLKQFKYFHWFLYLQLYSLSYFLTVFYTAYNFPSVFHQIQRACGTTGECSKCNRFNTIWTTGVARISSGMSVRKVLLSKFGVCVPSGWAVAVAAAVDAYHTSTGWCWAWASLEPGRVCRNAYASLTAPPVRRLPPCGDPENSTSFPIAY